MVGRLTKEQETLFQELNDLLNHSPRIKRIMLTNKQYSVYQKAVGETSTHYRGAEIVRYSR